MNIFRHAWENRLTECRGREDGMLLFGTRR